MPNPGRMLSHYRLVEKIGEGGMGVVWKAHDEKLDRTVALKVLKPELVGDEEHRQRFLREARSAAAVDHPFIASIFDADEADGTLFIAMEFVEGRTLRALIAKGPLPISEAQQYATEIAEGLATAHQAKLVHRDLKPDNVMVAKTGHAKILDFGLAKVVEKLDEAATLTLRGAEPAAQTTAGAILGTPAYMSPEQARGEPVDSRSDIFSFGGTVYEMVTGKAPFQRSTYTDTLASILRDEPLSPNASNPVVPAQLIRIISRCLHKKPEDRYNDTRDLVAALRDLRQPSGPQAVMAPHSAARPRTRVRLLSIVTVVAALALVAWRFWPRPVPPEPQPPSLGRPNWILVAEFQGPPDDPNLAVGARELVTAALERSKRIKPISGPDLKHGLLLAMKPDTTRVTVEVARELALRSRAEAYVEGRIDRLMEGYSIVLRAWDPEQNRLVTSVSGVAESRQVFISTLEALVRQMRVELGDVLTAAKQGPLAKGPMTEVMTSSLEACRKFHQGRELLWQGDYELSTRKLQEALQIDPDFSFAWFLLGINYWNLGDRDSARIGFEEALRRPERLTESQRLMVQADFANLEADLTRSVRLFDQLLLQDPTYITAYVDRGQALGMLGRYEDALESERRGQEMSPFGPIPISFNNEFWILLSLGRVEEARQVEARLEGVYRQSADLGLAVADADWDRAERLALLIRDDPTSRPWLRNEARIVLASVPAVRGEIEVATRALEDEVSSWRILLSVVSGRQQEAVAMPICSDSTTECLCLNGVQSAVAGDTTKARRYLDQISRKPLHERRHHDTYIAYLEAWIAVASNRWEYAARLMQAATPSGRVPISSNLSVEGGWLTAEASERMGQLEPATQHFERLLLPQWSMAHLYSGIWHSFVHHRLVLLYSKMGRVEDARRHWEIFEKTFTNPDPEFRPMIEEARQALAAAEAAL